MSADNLQRLVDIIDEQLKAATETVGAWSSSDRDWHARRDVALNRVAVHLGGYGASFAFTPAHDHRVTLAGIRSSSTSGLDGALRNWQAAARKRIAKEAA